MNTLRFGAPLDRRPVPVSLDDLATRIARLWSMELPAAEARRRELLSALSELGADIDAIRIRRAAGVEVHPNAVRTCAQRYLALRADWGDSEVAA